MCFQKLFNPEPNADRMKRSLHEGEFKEKHGIKIHVYTTYDEVPDANTCYVECDEGHFQEFYDKKSTFIYYVIEGNGTFYLDEKPLPAKATDVIIAKPGTKIYYLGKFKMLLTVAPAWEPENEVHVRYISKE